MTRPGGADYAYPVMSPIWHDRITADPAALVGKPAVRGRRLAVEFVLELIAGGWSAFRTLWPVNSPCAES